MQDDATKSSADSEPKRLYTNGAYFTKRDRNKAGTISIYTCKGRQTVKVLKLGTTDPEAAQIACDRFVLNDKEAALRQKQAQAAGISLPVDVPVLEAVNYYYLGKAEKLPSAATVRLVMKVLEAALPENPMVGKFGLDLQKKMIDWMRSDGYLDSSIDNAMTMLFTALRWSKKRLDFPILPEKISAGDWEPNFETDADAVPFDDLVRMFDYADARRRDGSRIRPWLFDYMMAGTASAARMTALRDLMRQQIDLRRKRCHLNPKGRRQTKKRRPVIPICDIWAAHLENCLSDGRQYVICRNGRRLRTLNSFKIMCRRLGIKATPMSVRRAVRTELQERGVSDASGDIFVGHAEDGSPTGRKHYKKHRHHRPDWLADCARAINELLEDISAGMRRPLPGARGVKTPAQMIASRPAIVVKLSYGTLRGKCVTTEHGNFLNSIENAEKYHFSFRVRIEWVINDLGVLPLHYPTLHGRMIQ